MACSFGFCFSLWSISPVALGPVVAQAGAHDGGDILISLHLENKQSEKEEGPRVLISLLRVYLPPNDLTSSTYTPPFKASTTSFWCHNLAFNIWAFEGHLSQSYKS